MKKRTKGIIQVAITLIVVLIPAIIMWVFLSKDWRFHPPLELGYVALISFGYFLGVFLIVLLLIKLHFCYYDMLNFTIPISLILVVIMLTTSLPLWARALIVFALILSAWPVNLIVAKYVDSKEDKAARIKNIIKKKKLE